MEALAANGNALSESTRPKTNNKRTLDVAPNMGEMVKPAELIEMKGAAKLTLADRRMFNVLLRHAFGPDLASEGRRFEIAVADLRETHESNDRLSATTSDNDPALRQQILNITQAQTET